MLSTLDHRSTAPAPLAPAVAAPFAPPAQVPSSADVLPTVHGRLAIVLLPLRLFLAAGWLRAGVEKLIDPDWWNGSELRGFLERQHDHALPFFRPVMDQLIAPMAVTVAVVVMVTQIACGVAIGLGRPLRMALRWGVVLNVSFVLAGAVNPSAFYLVMEMVLLLAIADGAIGRSPSLPSRRTLGAAAAAGGVALLFTPYIRTLQPADVIDDPAMMLSFLAAVLALVLVLRWVAAAADESRVLGRAWADRGRAWCIARPDGHPAAEVTGIGTRPRG